MAFTPTDSAASANRRSKVNISTAPRLIAADRWIASRGRRFGGPIVHARCITTVVRACRAIPVQAVRSTSLASFTPAREIARATSTHVSSDEAIRSPAALRARRIARTCGDSSSIKMRLSSALVST